MKKTCFSLLAFILILSLTASAFGSDKISDSTIKIIVDGAELKFDIAPKMVDGKVMAELKTLAEHVDAKIDWEQESRTVTVEDFLGNIAILQIGSKKAYLNGKEIYIDLEPQIVDNRTFIPLRSFSTYMGGSYTWFAERMISDIYFGRG